MSDIFCQIFKLQETATNLHAFLTASYIFSFPF